MPHYPYTFVIVDMRPGNQAILVQQKSSAFKNPDEVAALVTDYCSRVLQLSSLGLKMRLDKRLCKGSIWDMVSMRTYREQDRVKSFTLLIDKKVRVSFICPIICGADSCRHLRLSSTVQPQCLSS